MCTIYPSRTFPAQHLTAEERTEQNSTEQNALTKTSTNVNNDEYFWIEYEGT